MIAALRAAETPISQIGVAPLFTYSVANLVIVAAYLVMAFWVARKVPIRRYAKNALSIFYCCGALTHLTLGVGNVVFAAPIHNHLAWWLTAAFHSVQAVSICIALMSYYVLAGPNPRRQIVDVDGESRDRLLGPDVIDVLDTSGMTLTGEPKEPPDRV